MVRLHETIWWCIGWIQQQKGCARTMCGYLSGSGMLMSVSLMLRYCREGSAVPAQVKCTQQTQQPLHATEQTGRCSVASPSAHLVHGVQRPLYAAGGTGAIRTLVDHIMTSHSQPNLRSFFSSTMTSLPTRDLKKE